MDSWGGLMKAKEVGNTRSIGVCNFTRSTWQHHRPVVLRPCGQSDRTAPAAESSRTARRNAEHGIVTEAYGPLGVGNLLDNPTVAAIAAAHGKTPAQVLIRWNLQLGNVVIPRSSSPERIKANLDVFDFELTDDQMATLNGLDDGTRFRPDPETYTGT